MEIYYLGPDERLAGLLENLFAERGHTLFWPLTALAQKPEDFAREIEGDSVRLVIVDQRLEGWERLVPELKKSKKYSWVLVDPPADLGTEQELADHIHALGAQTYLARIYNPLVLTENLETAFAYKREFAAINAHLGL